MLRPQIILLLVVCLLSVGTVPTPIGRIKTRVIRNSVKREVNGMDLSDDHVPKVLPASNETKELPNLSYFENQLLKRDQPQLPLSPTLSPTPSPQSKASNLATELARSTVMTSQPMRKALNDSHSFEEKALDDLQRELKGDAINATSVSNLQPAPENLRNLSEDTILHKRLLENGADFEFGSEKQREDANKTLEYAANRISKNVSEIQLIPPISKSAVNVNIPSEDKSAFPLFSPQPAMNLPTTKFPANKEVETPTKSLGQAPPISIPWEHSTPSADLMKESFLPQRGAEHGNKPLLGMAEEIRLQNVMGKAQNMPLEYDASKSFLHPRQLESPSIDVANSASMNSDAARGSLGRDPMKINALPLPRTPFPPGDVSNKDKLMSRLFPKTNQQPNNQPPFLS